MGKLGIDDLVSIEGYHKIVGINKVNEKIFCMVEIRGSNVLLEEDQLVKAPEGKDE